jgi:hypothetical protein
MIAALDTPAFGVGAAVLIVTATAALLTWRWHSPGIFFGLLVVMALVGAVLYSLANPVPESEVGGLLIGTLISAFTLIMGWLFSPHRQETTMSHPHEKDDKPHEQPRDGKGQYTEQPREAPRPETTVEIETGSRPTEEKPPAGSQDKVEIVHKTPPPT